jgi:uncharacterized RDD family membrane protein YckC
VILDEHTHYCGFWRRLGATLIDSLLLAALAIPLVWMLGGEEPPGLTERLRSPDFTDWRSLLINYILPLVLTVFFWVRLFGTPGKLLLDCRVVDARSGGVLSVGQALLRYVAYIVSFVPLGLGFLWIGWDRRKQGFHDKIAKTVVVRDDESTKTLEELTREAQ